MKKIKLLPILILVLCLLCFAFAACGKKALDSPTGLSITDDYTLSWSAVKDARSYTIKVTPEGGPSVEHSSRRAYYSLSNLNEGKYIVNIKAVSGNDSYKDSAWSANYELEKDYESGCIYTPINNNTEYEVTRVGTASGEVVLGDYYRKKPVTSIADSAFKGSGKVEKIVVGKFVRTIGANAFYNCTKLKEIVLPDSVTTIGASAFHNCNQLKEITLPSGLTEIQDYSFTTCRSLLAIDIPDRVTIIGENAFYNCDALSSVTIPDSVKVIKEEAFNSCDALTSVTVGSGLQTLGVRAFYDCKSLVQIDFSAQSELTTIEEEAFYKCTALESLTLPEGLVDMGDKTFYECSSLKEIDLPDTLMHVGANAFNGTKIFTEATEDNNDKFVYADDWLVYYTGEELPEGILSPEVLKEGVAGIADRVFRGSKLTTVRLPDTVRAVGKYTFSNCTVLSMFRAFSAPTMSRAESDLKLIDDYAFSGCQILTYLFLNDGLQVINRYAFYNCTILDDKNASMSLIPSSVNTIGVGAFNRTKFYNESDGVVYAGNWVVGYNSQSGSSDGSVMLSGRYFDVRGIADYAFYNQSITGVQMPSNKQTSLEYVGRGAFYNCERLGLVSLGVRIKRIEDYTFYKCSSLYRVDFTEDLNYIGRSAFYKCTSLEEVDLYETGVEYIGPYAFYNCLNIKNIEFGRYLKIIDERAFYKCVSIEEINLPDTVLAIGERAFYHCEGLKRAQFGNSLLLIGNYAFSGCSTLSAVNIPDSVVSIGNYAFYKCSAVTSVELGNGVKSIGNYAFAYLTAIENLRLPASVESVGRYAFMRCSALTSVTLAHENLSLSTFSFYGCTAMTVYTDAASLPDNWHERWNISFRPVVWGCVLSEDGSYVISFTVGEDAITNAGAVNGLSAPEREGYAFVGWALKAEGAEEILGFEDLAELEAGTTVYAVWQEVID